MNEAYVKQALVKQLLEKANIQSYRFEDMFRSALPDMLVAKGGHCAWIEVKYSDDPLRPHTWKAYKPAQSESGRRLEESSGIRFYYFCRNNSGLFSISTVKLVVELISTKSSMQPHLPGGCISGHVKYVHETIDAILKSEVTL